MSFDKFSVMPLTKNINNNMEENIEDQDTEIYVSQGTNTDQRRHQFS